MGDGEAVLDGMAYGSIENVALPVSRLVLGAANFPREDAFATYDAFHELGGNCFDTAHIYGEGEAERVLGRWVASRGVRDRIVILDKGAHTPFCAPEHIAPQLAESLDRLGVEPVDVYMLHKDNRDVPVGEFLDALEQLRHEGVVRSYGASNWEVARLQAARRYAEAHDLAGFCAVSNQLSLAEMVYPEWPGSASAWNDESRAWFAETQTPLIPWTSQAAGYFAPGRHGKPGAADFQRCWDSEGNRARLARAQQLAAERGVKPITIALAWVLNQPYPTFPILGAKSAAHVRDAALALGVELYERECEWLRSGAAA